MANRGDITLVANEPNDNIYDFKGYMAYGPNLDDAQKEPLSLKTLFGRTLFSHPQVS